MAKIVRIANRTIHLEEASESVRLHNPHDKAGRFAAHKGGVHAVRLVFPGLAPDIKLVERYDTRSQPGPQAVDRTCDFVARLWDPQKPDIAQLANLELQGHAEGNEFARGFEYKARFYRELNVPENLRPNLIRWEPFTGFLFMTGSTPPDFQVNMELRGTQSQSQITVGARSLAEINAAEFLDKVAAQEEHYSLLYWTPLMKGAEKSSIIKQWCRLATNQAPARWLGDMKTVALGFSELAKNHDVWFHGTKDWNVYESALLKQWTEEAVNKAVDETGRKYCLDHLFAFLDARFPGKVPQTLRTKIKREKNISTLEKWLRTAYQVQTLADFRAAM